MMSGRTPRSAYLLIRVLVVRCKRGNRMKAECERVIGHVTRAIATDDLKTQALAWDEFRANAGEAFDVTYKQTEHFLVLAGEAKITFSDNVVLDITP
jgi:mannose-6-phosphate isomerase-like protein (cupin superfamily)